MGKYSVLMTFKSIRLARDFVMYEVRLPLPNYKIHFVPL